MKCDDYKKFSVLCQACCVPYDVKCSKVFTSEMNLKVGDLVISKKRHSCDVRFVEDVNDYSILLVNGIQDEYYEIEEYPIFNDRYELLCKREDRKDTER